MEEDDEDDHKKFPGVDPKSMPKPERYDCEVRGHQEWDDLFKATLTTNDEKWEDIINEIEAKGDQVIKKEERIDIMEKLKGQRNDDDKDRKTFVSKFIGIHKRRRAYESDVRRNLRVHGELQVDQSERQRRDNSKPNGEENTGDEPRGGEQIIRSRRCEDDGVGS